MPVNRRALLVGIEEYDSGYVPKLPGCVNDARRLSEMLTSHYDGRNNFDCKVLISPGNSGRLTRALLRKTWIELFNDFDGDILFYFSGHGMPLTTGGYRITQDGTTYDPGLAMNELFTLANQSRARSVLLILDCCYAGLAGNPSSSSGHIEMVEIREGVTLLAGSSSQQKAHMLEGRSIFTDLVIGALEGGAANVEGEVTAASIYAYVESSLGAFDQRPVYKSYARKLDPIRECPPIVSMNTVRQIMILFPSPDSEFPLDPEYEAYCLATLPPERSQKEEVIKHDANPKKAELREKLKHCQIAGLLKPKERRDLFWAALYSESIVLTPLGKYYWNRVTIQ
jgi:hypothetical protein